ncbi:hypothetical protein [Streptomyces sp. NBC_00989]|uniref:hypothetical protein n=1 Tax=Streptomyces sp. NBC_00989 TaxID=2903705 RepID=UPI003868FF62|nr:hypothetical protein OG714_43595 [Streptomyces sp. NBC_00989]
MTLTTARSFAPQTAIRGAASAAALAAGALLLTACGSMSTTASVQSGGSASASTRMQQQTAYRQCLSQHGFTAKPHSSASPSPSPTSGGASASGDAAREQAQKACASLRPKGGHDGRGASSGAEKKALATCLKEHGVALPSVSPGTGGPLGALNTADPKTAQALKTCKALQPKHGSGSPTASPSAST